MTNPWWQQYLEPGDFNLLCYDLIDDPVVFSGPDHYHEFLEWEKRLLARSDIVFYTAEVLGRKAEQNTSAKCFRLPNGVEAEWFQNRARDLPELADVAAIPRPRAGFVGSIFHWIDIEFVSAVIAGLPGVSFVFAGPVERPGMLDSLLSLRNFHYLGPKPYDQVPAYVNSFDVCLSFFKLDRLADAVDPVKVYEYLSLGKPVVASDIPEMAKFGDLVTTARDPAAFAQLIRAGIAEDSSDLKRRRAEYALKNSWSKRIDQMIEAIRQVWEQQ